MAPSMKTIDDAVDKIMNSERLAEAVRKAVKEAASEEFGKLIDRLERQESKIMDLETTQQSHKKEIEKLNGMIEGYHSRIIRLKRKATILNNTPSGIVCSFSGCRSQKRKIPLD